jgi:hypothetical protein
MFIMSGAAELCNLTYIQKKNCTRKFGVDECIMHGDHEVISS